MTLMLDKNAWLIVFGVNHPKSLFWGVMVQTPCKLIKFFNTKPTHPMLLWALFCVLVCSHVGTGRGHLQTLPTKFEAGNV